MNKSLIVLLLAPSIALCGESGGVRTSNFEAGASFTDSDIGTGYDAFGNYNADLAPFLASTLHLRVGQRNGNDNFLDTSSVMAGIDLFARSFEHGKIGGGYTRVRTSVDESEFDLAMNIDTYSVFAEYYFDAMTLTANRSTARPDDAADFSASYFTVSYYPTDNVRLLAGAGGLDAKETYSVGITMQPLPLNNTSFSVDYSHSPENDTVSLSISHQFGKVVSLRIGDREYR